MVTWSGGRIRLCGPPARGRIPWTPRKQRLWRVARWCNGPGPSPGPVNNTIYSTLLVFTIKDQSNKVCFYKHTIIVWVGLMLEVSWDILRLARHTWRSSGSNTQGGEESPWRMPWQHKNALQGSESDTRELQGGTKENKIPPAEKLLISPPGKLNT